MTTMLQHQEQASVEGVALARTLIAIEATCWLGGRALSPLISAHPLIEVRLAILAD